MNEEDQDNIELRSEEFQDVLQRISPWFLRWGIIVLSIIMVIFIIFISLYKYSDTITLDVSLEGEPSNLSIIAKSSGLIKTVYIKNGQTIKKGDYIAVLDNPICPDDVLYLKKMLDSLSHGYRLTIKDLSLGAINDNYLSLCDALAHYQEIKESSYFINKKTLIKREIEIWQSIQSKSENEIIATERDNYLMQSNRNIELGINKLKRELADIEYIYSQEFYSLKNRIEELKKALMTEIKHWESQYVFISPTDGQVVYAINHGDIKNKRIVEGEIIFTVKTDKSEGLFGKVLLPISMSDNIENGQKAIISFPAFPEQKYGVVKGVVKGVVREIFPVLVQKESIDYYILLINLCDGINTTKGFEIPYYEGVKAKVEIEIREKTVLQRLFD